MSPKAKVTKQQIIDAAFNIADREGLAAISVRKVAAALDCSVAPIYVNFKKADDLVQAVVDRALKLNVEYCMKPYTNQPFLNMGIGMVRLAHDHKRLYKDIVEKCGLTDNSDHEDAAKMMALMKSDTKLSGFSDQSIMRVLFKMRVVTYGLCVLVSAEPLPEGITLELLLDLLEETGDDVINGEKQRIQK